MPTNFTNLTSKKLTLNNKFTKQICTNHVKIAIQCNSVFQTIPSTDKGMIDAMLKTKISMMLTQTVRNIKIAVNLFYILSEKKRINRAKAFFVEMSLCKGINTMKVGCRL